MIFIIFYIEIILLNFKDSNYGALIDGFKEDLEDEISLLKEKYDEQREIDVEKIRKKYMDI